jgi:hypothetical protein
MLVTLPVGQQEAKQTTNELIVLILKKKNFSYFKLFKLLDK